MKKPMAPGFGAFRAYFILSGIFKKHLVGSVEAVGFVKVGTCAGS